MKRGYVDNRYKANSTVTCFVTVALSFVSYFGACGMVISMCEPAIDDTHLIFFFFLIEGYETSLSEGLHFEKRMFHSTFSTVSAD